MALAEKSLLTIFSERWRYESVEYYRFIDISIDVFPPLIAVAFYLLLLLKN